MVSWVSHLFQFLHWLCSYRILCRVDGGEETKLSSSIPPVWVDIVQGIEVDASDIRRNLTKLAKLHQQRLKVSFDDDDEAQDRKIDALAEKITNV